MRGSGVCWMGRGRRGSGSACDSDPVSMSLGRARHTLEDEGEGGRGVVAKAVRFNLLIYHIVCGTALPSF